MNAVFTQSKPVVAVDIDEVLAAFVPALLDFHNSEYESELTLSDFHSYRFCEVWGGTNDEAMDKIYHFFDTHYFTNIQPIAGALGVLTRHQRHFRFACVTSRQHKITHKTNAWIASHFPGLFEEIVFGNHWTREAPDPDHMTPNKRAKHEMCRSIGAIALIDDSIKYAAQCSEELGPSGFRVALFGDYPWNKGETPSAAVRAASWGEVDAFLEQLRVNHQARVARARVKVLVVSALLSFAGMVLLRRN